MFARGGAEGAVRSTVIGFGEEGGGVGWGGKMEEEKQKGEETGKGEEKEKEGREQGGSVGQGEGGFDDLKPVGVVGEGGEEEGGKWRGDGGEEVEGRGQPGDGGGGEGGGKAGLDQEGVVEGGGGGHAETLRDVNGQGRNDDVGKHGGTDGGVEHAEGAAGERETSGGETPLGPEGEKGRVGLEGERGGVEAMMEVGGGAVDDVWSTKKLEEQRQEDAEGKWGVGSEGGDREVKAGRDYGEGTVERGGVRGSGGGATNSTVADALFMEGVEALSEGGAGAVEAVRVLDPKP